MRLVGAKAQSWLGTTNSKGADFISLAHRFVLIDPDEGLGVCCGGGWTTVKFLVNWADLGLYG
ncbi:uncharacterized protein J3R85_003272 [Psidium guajava]|nr:uncharacterized protein J3R85_003272 [Psidium guajava]